MWTHFYIIIVSINEPSFSPERQRLIFGGQELENFKTIAEYEIKEEFVLHLVLKQARV